MNGSTTDLFVRLEGSWRVPPLGIQHEWRCTSCDEVFMMPIGITPTSCPGACFRKSMQQKGLGE